VVGVEGAFEVVDLVVDEAGESAVEGGDVAGAVDVLVLDVDGKGRGTLPRTSKKDSQPSYWVSVSTDWSMILGLRMVMWSPSGFG
jgi:hypothetical protein